MARIVKRPVAFADDCVGPKAEAAIAAMKDGDILCLENTRFHPEEEKNDKEFAEKLAALGDIFVDDAFSVAHREHASNTSIVTVANLAAYPGRAMKAEIDALEKAFETPAHPVTAIVGGAKVSTKLDLLGHLLPKVETLIIGGGMANTFLAAQGKSIGKSLCEYDLVATARDILAKAKRARREIVLPVDAVVAQKLADHVPSRVVSVDEVGAADMILDIGPRTVEHVISVLARSKTLVWNGPFGAFEHEPFDHRHGRGGRGGRGTHGGRQACQFCGRRRYGGGAQPGFGAGSVDPCIDRRRRVPGIAGGQNPARREGALGRRDYAPRESEIIMDTSPPDRRRRMSARKIWRTR